MSGLDILEEKRTLSEIEEFSTDAKIQANLDGKLITSANNFFLSSCIVGATVIPSHELVAKNTKFTTYDKQSIYVAEDVNEDINKHIAKYIEEINSLSEQTYSKHSIIKEILSFKSLKENWDGYGAWPLEIESASNALMLMDLVGDEIFCRTTNFFPNSNGTITFEWENEEEEIVSVEVGNEYFSYFVEMASQEPLFFDKIPLNGKETKKLAQYIKAV